MTTAAPSLFTVDDLRARRTRLHAADTRDLKPRLHAGDHVTDPSLAEYMAGVTLRDAAVLVTVSARPDGAVVMLTRRTDHLAAHAGQIAFPGGKIDPGDSGPVSAALREAEEEIGLDARLVEPLGLLDPYVSNSGYRIFPVVALVEPFATVTPNPDEVADVFEVPLAFLMSPSNHLMEHRPWRGAERRYYAMPFGPWRIWGVTAGIIRLFHDQVYA
ncbi:MAG TPA: CoA pyrophosphatase [Methylomirabilota bacterium]|nr:CoA pyrophosphatase [Methylomirabilota bacterium]